MDHISALQQLFDAFQKEFNEIPRMIIVSPSLLDKMLDSRLDDLRFPGRNSQRIKGSEMHYIHGNNTIRITTEGLK